jgi:predicted protein tyrosine phosphatase
MARMSRNQEGVVFNRWQGDAVKALFVCSAGILRSPTAALHFAKTKGWNTRAVGDNEEFALIPVSEALMFWADIVFVMSVDQKIHLKHKFGQSFEGRIFVMNIEDNFGFMESDLVKYLEASMEHLTPEVEEFLKTKGTK